MVPVPMISFFLIQHMSICTYTSIILVFLRIPSIILALLE